MKRISYLAVAVVLAAAVALIMHISDDRRQDGDVTTLSVLCGAGLRPPVAEIVEVFQEETGIRVEVSYAASNLLLGQLKLAQRGDVFMPGDEFYVEQAQAENLVDEPHTVAFFLPVILVQEGNPLGIQGLDDLAKDGLRLGLADERAAAVGRVARQILNNAGISTDAVERNLRYTSTTVHELADAVRLRHIDAAIVWNAVARQYPSLEIVNIPIEHNIQVAVPAAIVTASANHEAAGQFIDFLVSKQGEAIFLKHYYNTFEVCSQ